MHGAHPGIIATYCEPLGRIHSIPAFPQLLEGHGRVGRDFLMLVPGDKIESESACRYIGVSMRLVKGR